jgi:hypothetical protein
MTIPVSWTPVDEVLANAEQYHERYADAIRDGFWVLSEPEPS